MKLLVRRDALEKIVNAFESLLVELPRDPSDRERTMLRWFREFLSDDVSPVDRVLRQLGRLKLGWERPLSQVEMHEMNGSLDTLATFTDAEWSDIGAWLSYKPKSYEKLYQVQNRQSFLRSPVDTLTAAETWKDANRPARRKEEVTSGPVGDVMTKEEMLAILRGGE